MGPVGHSPNAFPLCLANKLTALKQNKKQKQLVPSWQ